MTNTVPYYEDFVEIKKKIWSMLDNAVKDRSSSFRIPVFICGSQSDLDGRIVVLRKSDEANNLVEKCMQDGLLLFFFLFNNSSVRISPPLTISFDEIEKGCNIILKNLN